MDGPLVKTFLPTGHKIDKINIHKLIMITIIVLFRFMLFTTTKVDFLKNCKVNVFHNTYQLLSLVPITHFIRSQRRALRMERTSRN